MAPQERQCRSELAKLLSQYGILRGSPLRRQRVCGKPNCRCTRGQKHESLYLLVSEGGKLDNPARFSKMVGDLMARALV